MSVHEMERRRDDYFCSNEFVDDMYDLAVEYMESNRKEFVDWWHENSFEYTPSFIFKDVEISKDDIVKDFIHAYEDMLQDHLMERFEDDWY